MDERGRQKRLERFRRICRERGVPFTVQCRAVLDAVLGLDNHPTADQVHDAVVRRLPGVSRTTVYLALDVLVRMGMITTACHPGRVVRYDRRTDSHHHLICLRCDRVIDIRDERLDSVGMPDTSASGFAVSDYTVQLRGVCRDCAEQEETS